MNDAENLSIDNLNTTNFIETDLPSSNHRRLMPARSRSFDGAPESSRRRRVTQACDQCRGRKEKCDGKRPKCSKCFTTRQKCSYGSTPKRRGLPTGYVRGLEMLLGLVFNSIDNSEETVRSLLVNTLDATGSAMPEAVDGLLRAWRKSSVAMDLERFLPRIEGIEAVPSGQKPFENEALGQKEGQPSFSLSLSFLPSRHLSLYKIVPNSETTYTEPTRPSLASLPASPAVSQSSTPYANPIPSEPILLPRSLILPPTNASQDGALEAVSSPQGGLTARTCLSSLPFAGRSSGLSADSMPIFWSKSCLLSSFSQSEAMENKELPLPANADRLIDIYFSRTHSWLPVIVKHDILRFAYSYSRGKLTLKDCQQDSEKHAILWAVMAFATLQESSITQTGNNVTEAKMNKELAWQYYKLARSLIPTEESNFGIGHVQALLVLTLFNLGQGIWTASWLLVGQAVRLAVSIGADKPSLGVDRANNSVTGRRRRAFLGCFVLDTLVSARLGRIPHLQHINISAAGLLEEDGLEEWEPWIDPLRPECSSSSEASYKGPARILSIFNHLVAICGILNDLLRHGYGSNSMSNEDYQTQYGVLQKWLQNLPGHCQLSGEADRVSTQPAMLPQILILHLVYLTSVMILRLDFCASGSISSRERDSLQQNLISTASNIFLQIQKYADLYGFQSMPPFFEYFACLAGVGQSLKDNVWRDGRKEQIDFLVLVSKIAAVWPAAECTRHALVSSNSNWSHILASEPVVYQPTNVLGESPFPTSNNASTVPEALSWANSIFPAQGAPSPKTLNMADQLVSEISDLGSAALAGSGFESQNPDDEDVDMRPDDLAFLEGLEWSGYQPQFLQNLGYDSDAALTGFFPLYNQQEFQLDTNVMPDAQLDITTATVSTGEVGQDITFLAQ